MPETFPRGRFVWHELLTTAPDAAVRFYGTVVGWGVEPYPNAPDYRVWTMRGTSMGGLMRLPEEARRMGAPPNWLTYVAVPDVDTTLRQAQGLGARVVVQPREIPSVGRFATLADPAGASFAVFRPAGDQMGSDEPTPGDFSWHELATNDWRSAWEFYRALFGWEKADAMDMGPAGTYQMFRRVGHPRILGGLYNKPPEMPAPPHWLSYVQVPGADAAAETVTKLGGKVVNGPMEVPGGDRIAMCIDPQGAAFAVHSVAAKPAAKLKKKPPMKPKAKKTKVKKATKSARQVVKRRTHKRTTRRR